jgi:hypothetical protein
MDEVAVVELHWVDLLVYPSDVGGSDFAMCLLPLCNTAN